MNQKIRLGVIGIGFAWERLHYPALKRLADQYEIIAVCNKTIDKAQGFAKRISLADENIYSDYKQLLQRGDIDAVDVLVPISENYEVAKDVIIAKKNLIAEKPFSATLEGANELIKLKNEHKVKVMVAENYRYAQENTIIKELITSGTIGEVIYFIQNTGADFAKQMMGDTFAAKEWRQHPAFHGGIFLDGGIHDIARLRFLFGDIESLYSIGRPQEEEYCPYMAINTLFKFHNGVAGQYAYYSSGSELQKPPVGLRIFGTLGEIYLESKDSGKIQIFFKDGRTEQRSFIPEQGYYEELLNFYNGIVKNEVIASTPEKEIGDMKIIFDILKSIEKNEVL